MTIGLTEIVFSAGYNPFALLRTKKNLYHHQPSENFSLSRLAK